MTVATNPLDHPSLGTLDLDFAAMLDNYTRAIPARGLIMQGRVLRVADDAIYLDVGAKRDAIVPTRELDLIDDVLTSDIALGDALPVYIERLLPGDELLQGSLEKGLAARDWQVAQTSLDNDETLELEVVGYNKGGLLVQFGRLQGFVPNSHVTSLRHADSPQAAKAHLRGERIALKIIEVDADRQRLVLSQKQAERVLRQAHLDTLEVGQIITGTVINTADFGAFVDLGYGLVGLAHISQLSYGRIEHPDEVVTAGAPLKVLVEKIDRERGRISLNHKAVVNNPWVEFAESHAAGDRVAATVVKVTDFGIFARLANGLEGLIHVTELPDWMARAPHEALRIGDSVLTAVLDINVADERLRLSLKRVSYEEEMTWMQTCAVA